VKRSQEKELMDLPGQPRELLQEDLRNLRNLNRWLGGSRAVMRGVQRAVKRKGLSNFSLLDVGTGSADMPETIVRWAINKGFSVRIVGLEAEPVTAETALMRTTHLPQVSIVRADATRPPFLPRSFDFVLASQLLHHFSEATIVKSLRAWSEVARTAIIISDLVRHPAAYYGIRCLTRLTTSNIMTLTDGPLSVERAFTSTEWRDLFSRAAVGKFELFSLVPFRMLAIVSLNT
jgi:2-polyprenyl-3-methyl-5-hydroxy-6-metoxy-1,4-benzoquinol methylase